MKLQSFAVRYSVYLSIRIMLFIGLIVPLCGGTMRPVFSIGRIPRPDLPVWHYRQSELAI
jgi:hypothetical protein